MFEYALPNSKDGFFDKSIIQRFHGGTPDICHHYHTEDYAHNMYDNKMMVYSEECMSFSVNGPRFFDNPIIVETFNQWSEWNHSNSFYQKIPHTKIVIMSTRAHCLEINMRTLRIPCYS